MRAQFEEIGTMQASLHKHQFLPGIVLKMAAFKKNMVVMLKEFWMKSCLVIPLWWLVSIDFSELSCLAAEQKQDSLKGFKTMSSESGKRAWRVCLRT